MTTSDSLTALADVLPHAVVLPGDETWDTARTPWNLAVDQHPAAVVLPRTAEDVATAVTAARDRGLAVAVQGTGHNAAPLAAHCGLDGALLLNMSGMQGVSVDPETRTAWVEAGTLWGQVTAAAAVHGLAALAGSSADVGVVGYTLGGGVSWLARAHGLAANHVTAVEVVTADGKQRRVDAFNEPDLFWAVRGGGGNFGVVTALEFQLFEMADIFAGAMFWPVERADEVLHVWRAWVEGIPERVTSAARVMHFPPMPELPEPLRGNSYVVVEAAMLLEDHVANDLLAGLRDLGPAMDTFGRIPMTDLAQLHMDPPGPVPGVGDGLLLRDLDEQTITQFASVASAESMLLSCEFRHLGGALTPGRVDGGAVSGLDADFLFFAVGVAPVPEAAAAVAKAVQRVKGTLEPVRAARTFSNFCESAASPESLYGPSLERLRAVRDRYDPQRIMRAHQPLG